MNEGSDRFSNLCRKVTFFPLHSMDTHSSAPPSLQPMPSVPTDGVNLSPSNQTVGNGSRCDDSSPEKAASRSKKKTKRVSKDAIAAPSSSSGSSFRSTRVACKRRSLKMVFSTPRRNPNADEIAFRLGMSFAAFVAQIFERNSELGEGMPCDHLAKICASAVRESLSNDFGNTFDCFIKNFEESFGSTLRTLKSIKESSTDIRGRLLSYKNIEASSLHVTHGEQDDCLRREGSTSTSDREACHSDAISHTNATQGQINYRDEVDQDMLTDAINLPLALQGHPNELSCISPRTFESATNQPILRTIGKSVVEQARANDLKTMELNLTLQRLKLKETQLALHYNTNQLEKSKFAMGISKASFKAEKFKTQLEDARHAELLRKCIDCLVAGLLVMTASLLYGAYVYSYKRLTDATASCTPSTKESKPWYNWLLPMASFSSGFHVLSCKVQVVSRMLFGVIMIVAISLLILQRSATAKQTMPATFIVLLLGIGCGIAGMFCIDTLGGNWLHWLLHWEMFCILHFVCNSWTSIVFYILHGPVDVSLGTKRNPIIPYWIRRLVFYGMSFLFLPLFCGLLPFASLGEWKHHFLLLFSDFGYY